MRVNLGYPTRVLPRPDSPFDFLRVFETSAPTDAESVEVPVVHLPEHDRYVSRSIAIQPGYFTMECVSCDEYGLYI